MITFSHPWFLFGGIVLSAWVVAAFVRRARRSRRLAAFLGGSRAASRLSRRDLFRLKLERIALLIAASMAIAAAAAGPGEGPQVAEPDPAAPQGQSVIVAIDVSSSMMGTDIAPTRLGAAVRVARGLVESLEGSEVGLILLAGKSYTLTPPTRDHRAIFYLLRGVTPTTGTPWDREARLSVGIREGVTLLSGSDAARERVIFLISDGSLSEPAENAAASAREAVARGIEVHTIGVGSSAVDAPEFGEDLLRRLAEIGGGTYSDGVAAVSGSSSSQRSTEGFPRRGLEERQGEKLIFWLIASALGLLFVDGLLDGRVGGRKHPSVGVS